MSTSDHSYLFKMNFETLQDIVSKEQKCIENLTSTCYNSKRSVTEKHRYPTVKVKYEDKKHNPKISVVVKAYHYRLLEEEDWDEGLHVSHLCHNKKCIFEEHLVVEEARINYDRNYCIGTVICKECKVFFNCCKHIPKCLKETFDKCSNC
jgi:hypothetical protein